MTEKDNKCSEGKGCCCNHKNNAENESDLGTEGHQQGQSHEHKCGEMKKQYDDLKETLQRVFAEYQNFKRRTVEEKQETIQRANEELLKHILPILDNMELALGHKTADDKFRQGIEMIYAQFVQTLEDEGVKKILSSGKYDPRLHEILMTEESDKEEGVILEEFQKGYMLGGKVLRHAKVKIAKAKSA